MNAKEILAALHLPCKVSANERAHAQKLSELYRMVKEISKDVIKVTIESKPIKFGQYTDWSRKPVLKGGTELPGEKWTIETAVGCYKISLPIANDFYHAFCELLPAFVPKNRPQIEPDYTINLDGQLVTILKNALNFVSPDKLRPAMTCVFFKIENGHGQIVSTDGVRLFKENFKSTMFGNVEVLLPSEQLKSALKKSKGLTIELFKDRDTIKCGLLNGVRFENCDHSFPNYMSVWPKLNQYFEVDRAAAIQAIKSMIPALNQVTYQINLHVNGRVDFAGENIDFGFENSASVSHVAKTTPDLDLSFNAKYLLQCLGNSKDKTVKIYNDGKSKCALIDSNTLLMQIRPY